MLPRLHWKFLFTCALLTLGNISNAAADLRTLLTKSPLVIDGTNLRAPMAVREFYKQRNYAAVWRDNEPRLQQLHAAITSADAHGLTPANYHQAKLKTAQKDNLELLATDAWLALAATIIGGQLNPVTIEPDWTAMRRERNLVAHLEQAIATNTIAEAINELEPNAPTYRALKLALKTLREQAAVDPTPPIAAGAALKQGMTSGRIPALRQKLAARGYDAGDLQSNLYDATLVETVKAYQRTAGLEDDGIVGAVTSRLLNMTNRERERMLIINMERWRWLPEDLGERHVRVNIADFSLEARYRGVVEQSHPVIVGRDYRRTPVFSDRIRYMIFNPWWETPPSIARKDKLPDFQKNPEKVRAMGFDVYDQEGNQLNPDNIDWRAYRTNYFPLRIRQRPGPLNALGQVKIMFPNSHNVYLHDTASRELFQKTERAFSSGCVRVKNALELAKWVLKENPESDLKTMASALDSGKETRINVSKPVPVHILYFTVVMGTNGQPMYLNDLYQRDERISLALDDTKS